MIETSPDPNAAILSAWNTGKIVHRRVAIAEALVLAAGFDSDLSAREVALSILRICKHPALASLVAAQLRDCDPEARLLGLDYLKRMSPAIGAVMAELFDKIGWFDRVLTLVSYLVALVATASILSSIYNSMNERRRDLAILRALGARRATVFSVIVLEAAAIAALGMAAGFGIYLGLMAVVAGIIRAQTGVVLDPFAFNPVMLWSPAAFIALGALSGIIPAMKAYRTDVASNLTPQS